MIGARDKNTKISFSNFDIFSIIVALMTLLKANISDIIYPITKLIDNNAIGNMNAARMTLKIKYGAEVIDQ